MKLVISQPMYMPWYGLFEQIRAADVFVHYDDVQLPIGKNFITRVQIKTSGGVNWLAVPLNRDIGRHANINEYRVVDDQWRQKHLAAIRHAYGKASNFHEMFDIVARILANDSDFIATINQMAIESISRYFGFGTKFMCSSSLDCPGRKTERILNICLKLGVDTYITGWGAKNYLDHELLEKNGIEVQYPKYACVPYRQLHGDFTQYVSILDMIAHCGHEAIRHFASIFVNWRDFVGAPQ